jgi:hypothetical protein
MLNGPRSSRALRAHSTAPLAFRRTNEDLDELNDSWEIEVSGITEHEGQERVNEYPDEVRGVILNPCLPDCVIQDEP